MMVEYGEGRMGSCRSQKEEEGKSHPKTRENSEEVLPRGEGESEVTEFKVDTAIR